MNFSKNKKTSQGKVFFSKRDGIFIGLVLLAALLLWLILGNQAPQSSKPGAKAVVITGTGAQQKTQELSLSTDQIVVIQEGVFPVELEIKDGAIRFINSLCPDHLCEGFGWIRRQGEEAVCMPAKVMVRVEE